MLYSEDGEARCVLCTECTVRTLRRSVCCTARTVRHGVCVLCCVVYRMHGEDSEAQLCEAKSLSMTTLRMTAEAKVC